MKRFLCWLLSGLIMGWGGGFATFVMKLPEKPAQPLEKTDGLVVFTGGPDRVETALNLMEQGFAKRLLISGVNTHVSLEDLVKMASLSSKRLNLSGIDLDYDSGSTSENAQQTAQWVQHHEFSSIRLVTAHYHMPRSLAEFRARLPKLYLISHPVVPQSFQNTAWIKNAAMWLLLVREYHKYTGVLIRQVFHSILLSF